MDDLETPAPEAGDEGIAAPEAVEEEIEGQEEGQPAEVAEEDTAAEEEKTRSQERRERRRAEIERLRQSEAQSLEKARRAEEEVARMREAAQRLPRPKQADFPDLASYQAALTAFATAQAWDQRQLQSLQQEAERSHAETRAAQDAQRQVDAQMWAAQVDDARARYPDFERVAQNPNLPVTDGMARIITASDNAADILYYLGKTPEVAAQIAALPPVQAALAIGRIDAQVSAPKQKPKVSNAPDPISPVRPKATAPKNPDTMSAAEYRAWREAGGSF